jgi:DNA (cytosine-5)-methyltransferase 1
MTDIIASDHFCGGGGTSTGLVQAIAKQHKTMSLLAINHWERALQTHRANYPWADHRNDDLDTVQPKQAVPGKYLDLLVTSPECTYHSKALGGKPVKDQSRMTAMSAVRWASELHIENILIENVPEFMDWGPLDDQDRPIKTERGRFFLEYLSDLRSLGYKVDHRILCAADYGAPTTRERLFIQARKSQRITWPEPTHTKDGDYGKLFGTSERWVPAREIIDWSIKGESIFDRKRPLRENTLNRIKKGLLKFSCKPFLAVYHGTTTTGGERVQSIDEPLPTVDTSNRYGLCQPFVVALNHGNDDNRSYSLDAPFPTVTSVDAWGLCEPFLVKYYGTGAVQGVDEPLGTVTTKDRFGLCVPVNGGQVIVDVLFRMLQPKELAAAMSFPEEYIWKGNREETVKQIGNAVPPLLAESIISAMIV